MRLAASLLLLLQLLLALFCCAVVLAVYQSCRSYRWARLSDVNFSDNRIIIAHRRAHRRHLPPLLPYAGCYSCQPASAQAKLSSLQASVTHKLPSVRQFVPSSVCVCFYCFFFLAFGRKGSFKSCCVTFVQCATFIYSRHLFASTICLLACLAFSGTTFGKR